jgi:sulfate adenylyltransferase subunit 2
MRVEQNLNELEEKSIYIIREAFAKFKNPVALWSMGKDSTTMLYLIKEAMFGKIPCPVLNLDSGLEFEESYKFRDMLAEKWHMNLIVQRYYPKPGATASEVANGKTEALKEAMKKYKFDAVFVGIRNDENPIRGKERHMSKRDENFKWHYGEEAEPEVWDQYGINDLKEGEHYRIHPILDWNELSIWRFIKKKKIPVNPLYFAKNGKRFRSIGEKGYTTPIDSNADTIDKIIEEIKTSQTKEREGRDFEKEQEHIMEKLRAFGYM